MILPDEPKAQDVPKIIQPRNHKARVSVWADLTVDDLDRINESLNADHIKMVLADIFHLDDHKTSLKTGIVMDLYYYTLQFARENKFTKEQTSAFFSIVKKTHEICIETPFGNLDETFSFFKEMVLCHAVNRPPHSIELFTADQVRLITEYTVNSYFRHFKMYKYAFTPMVRLDLSINYVGIPPTPVPSEETKESGKHITWNLPSDSTLRVGRLPGGGGVSADEGEGEPAVEEPQVEEEPAEPEKTPEPESAARKELRGMIQTYLTEEIKKMKLSMDDQLKTTEELLSKKLDVAEGGGAKKGGRNSAKGGKKK
ncbi:cilia- and flagella-associated protein 119-like isoform X2 [Ruditapes philippinarum]|uniref:cilia- and flagella-associated protein 119-like isoform X2 n=1 Tax=Ruditapes philippinarum TaxID=129788 RepID=UPI00295ADE69|nr:cilia- and flagella-associated protein 119-like isoform X2 [Ruditapes philippinarum]